MNEKKSKIMKIKRIKKNRTEFGVCSYLEEINFEEVDQFVYLGVLIMNKYKEVREIDAKLSKPTMQSRWLYLVLHQFFLASLHLFVINAPKYTN